MRMILALLALAVTPTLTLAEPVKLELKVPSPWTLDTGEMTVEAFAETVKKAEEGPDLPPAQKIDLIVRLKNTSDDPVDVWTSGDPVMLTLELKGPGAADKVVSRFFTREFRIPKATTIKPGESHEMKLSALDHGFRGAERRAYITAPGEYTLSATLKTGIKPPPPGSMESMDFGVTQLKSEPVTIKVMAKE